MKKLTKLLIVVLAAVVLTLCFASCAKTTYYTVTFKNGEETVATVTVEDGKTTYAANVTTSEGVRFDGWYDGETKFDFATAITKDMTLTAKFTSLTYTVTYDLGYKEADMPAAPTQNGVNYNGTFTVAAEPTRVGYVFLGWSDGSKTVAAGSNYVVSDADNVVLVATWEYKTVTVRFFDDTGIVDNLTKQVPYGSDVIAPTKDEVSHTYACYELDKWQDEQGNDAVFSAIKTDVDYYAAYDYLPSDDRFFSFTLNEDGQSYSISINGDKKYDYDDPIPDYLVLPKEYDGKPVNTVAEEGFTYLDVTRLHIPGSIKTIKPIGFYQLREMTDLEIEEGVERLETISFASCYSVSEVRLPSTINYIGFNVFYRFYGLQNIVIAQDNQTFKVEDGFVKSLDGTKLYTAIYPVVGNNCTIGKEVTWIAPGLFCDDNLLTSITIDADLDYIGCGTFYQSGIQTVTINGVIKEIHGYTDVYTKYPMLNQREQYNMMPYGAFEATRSLTTLTFKDGLTYIGGGVMHGGSLTSITLPDSLEQVAIDAFFCFGEPLHQTIKVVGNNANAKYYTIDDSAFLQKGTDGDTLLYFAPASKVKEFVIPQNVKDINYYAFECNANLESVTVPEGITSLKYGVFSNCQALKTVSLPSTLTEFQLGSSPFSDKDGAPVWSRVQIMGESSVFAYCLALANVVYPNGNNVTKIPAYTFNGTALTSFTITAKLTEFTNESVSSEKLTEWIVEEGCTLDYSAENGILYNKAKTTLINYPAPKTEETFTLPATVKTVARLAFFRANNLKSLTFNEGLETLGPSAVVGCENLETITFPTTLTSIDITAVAECAKLKIVEFKGESLELVREDLFSDFILFTYFFEDEEHGVFEYRLANELVIKVPNDKYIAYYEIFFEASAEYSDRIDDSGIAKVTYKFDSKGGNDVAAVTAVVLTNLEKPVKKDSFFWGWYLQDGTQEGVEWTNLVQVPYYYAEGNEVTLYARWENERKQDGLSWETCYDVSDPTTVINIDKEGTYYFCFTVTATGKLIDGTNGLPFTSETLEGIASSGNRAWAMLYSGLPKEGEDIYEYMIPRAKRYVQAGHTYYMTIDIQSSNPDAKITFPISFSIEFKVDTSKLPPSANTMAAILPDKQD